MTETAKRAAIDAVERVLQARHPGMIWTVVPEGEEPSSSAAVIFRIDPPRVR